MSEENEVLNDFLRNTANHTMRIHRDDGLYRHVEFSHGGSSCYRFDLITWPGYLTVCGDMGTWTFQRLADMFGFFGCKGVSGGINTGYWAEKLEVGAGGGGRDICMEFDEESFKSGLREWLKDYCDDNEDSDVVANAINEVCDGDYSYEHEACQALYDADLSDTYGVGAWDILEGLTLRKYTHHYQWILYAIVWGIQHYNASKNADQSSQN